MGDKDKNVDDLTKMLDDTLKDFDTRRVTDDDLDDFMADLDKQAVERTGQQFDQLLNKISEAIANDDGGPSSDTAGSSSQDPELNDFMNMIQRGLLQNDISPMINTTVERYDAYFATEGATLSPEVRDLYQSQRDTLHRLSKEYSTAGGNYTPEKEAEIQKLWQELHELGDPPEHLFNMNQGGVPVPPECSIM